MKRGHSGPPSTQTILSSSRRLMRTGMHSAKQSAKESKGEEREELHCHHRDMGKAKRAEKTERESTKKKTCA